MDIAGVSVALANVSTRSQVSTAVLDKAMENNEQLGAGIVEMMNAAAMELSVNPGVGANFDMRI
ncbi:MAG: putative motility protein [Lachnospiraceae bacterium]|nr:putative motility protein [Lachnospiraceae bacterium]